MGLYPFNVQNLLGGKIRALAAPISESLADSPADVFDQQGPNYDPNGDWFDFGATTEGTEYEREFGSEGYEIEQTTATVLEEMTESNRSVAIPLGEFTQKALEIFEEGVPDDVASGTGISAYERVSFGDVDDLTPYRLALVAQRAKASGATVTEHDGTIRGAFVVFVFHRVAIAADSASIELAKGSLSSIPVALKAIPDPDADPGKEHGDWWIETPGTIVGS